MVNIKFRVGCELSLSQHQNQYFGKHKRCVVKNRGALKSRTYYMYERGSGSGISCIPTKYLLPKD